ncbi:lipopolysaccharide biosynthesis protein [Elizabethkingia anophelis]|uniref:lipopolysaccharide biosynthesis protein n=1 Tax=Elizabethkingia anophelis TaxID=1117645 RepID=UPI00137006B5|nr:oligosaccharide flippase family protein [Elizabethkingia anophelis]MYY26421.1 hypothetical protein [Elizabethkingia anophelis]
MPINQIKIGAILSYISIFLSVVVSFSYTPFMLKYMGQAEYGLYSLALTIVSYLSLMDFGFGAAIVRYSTIYRHKEEKEKLYELYGLFFKMYTIIGVVCFVVGIGLYFLTPYFFSKTLNPDELTKIKIIILIIVTYLSLSFPFSVFSAIITSFEKFIFLKAMNIVRSLLVPLIMIPLLLLGYKSITMTIVMVGVGVLISIVNVFYCFRNLEIKIKFTNYKKELIMSILGFSLLVFGKDFFERITWSSGQFILGSTIGAVSVAIFAIAIQIKGYYETFCKTLTNLFLPRIVSYTTKEDFLKHFEVLFIKLGRIQFHLLGYIMVIYLLVGESFINLWAGHNYNTAYKLSLFIMIPYTIPLIQSLGGAFLQAVNKLRIQLYIYGLEALIIVILTVVLSKYLGIYSAALALCIGIFVSEIILINIYWKTLGINIWSFWKEIFKIFIPLLIFCIIGYFIFVNISIHSLKQLCIYVVLITIPYVFYIYRFGMNSYERGIIATIINKIYKR